MRNCTHVLLGKKPTRVVKTRSRMIPLAPRVALHSERICSVTSETLSTAMRSVCNCSDLRGSKKL